MVQLLRKRLVEVISTSPKIEMPYLPAPHSEGEGASAPGLFQQLQQQALVLTGGLGELGGFVPQAGQDSVVVSHQGVRPADGLRPVEGLYLSGGGQVQLL